VNYYNELVELQKNSYCPYSNFQVAAIFKLKNGNLIKGVNIENASYGATNCAERSALFTLISNGVSPTKIKEIHLMGSKKEKKPSTYFTPCGICRQVLIEHIDRNVNIFVYKSETNILKIKISELFNHPFVLGE